MGYTPRTSALNRPTAFTVGHSTHSTAAFLALLREAGVECVADVRRYPSSRRFPQFNAEALAAALEGSGIEYAHLPGLGGRRRPLPDATAGAGWRVEAFRGYADHMATPEFERSFERLEALARERRAAVMCAEGLWWRCHRRLVADALTVRGFEVVHLGPAGQRSPHELTPFAVVEQGRLSYPAEQAALDL